MKETEVKQCPFCGGQGGGSSRRMGTVEEALSGAVVDKIINQKEIEMKNYICLQGRKTELTEEQVRELLGQVPDQGEETPTLTKLGTKEVGSLVAIGDREYIVLDQFGKETALLMKDLLEENFAFGKNNDYRESNVKVLLDEFACELERIVGAGNLIEHTVDLTSDDGLKDYGETLCKVSLMTAEMYRKYVTILDRHKSDKNWWLATPFSTPTHENDTWGKCVSPRGGVIIGHYCSRLGVRPFWILNSDILVS